ncbi:Glutaredoxin [Sporobacter termitidis DSM 10068]|uniref:Glutaredoxin n=1 Tax=Sporobacter termitidis DSM 10068 TaxID=1123282 RepID=A0A1M5XRA4_9FIRM|nr:thioredoxin family protein [Sporobacter termitidis]SHI02365.1 Glutaredoxin [Sporobacter termitidis DSM 10068]
MKDVLMFMTSWCPYCKKAFSMIDEVRGEKEAYKDVEIVTIDEDKERKYADTFDYYRVPTFYVDGEKVHEGAATIDNIRKVFELAVG